MGGNIGGFSSYVLVAIPPDCSGHFQRTNDVNLTIWTLQEVAIPPDCSGHFQHWIKAIQDANRVAEEVAIPPDCSGHFQPLLLLAAVAAVNYWVAIPPDCSGHFQPRSRCHRPQSPSAEVAIPPDCSGHFQPRRRRTSTATLLRRVAIPPDCSGHFQLRNYNWGGDSITQKSQSHLTALVISNPSVRNSLFCRGLSSLPPLPPFEATGKASGDLGSVLALDAKFNTFNHLGCPPLPR